MAPALADPIKSEDYKTHHSMGCLMMRECVDKVDQILSTDDLTEKLGSDYSEYGSGRLVLSMDRFCHYRGIEPRAPRDMRPNQHALQRLLLHVS